jgi:predicted  nucleic acid-binding Zn-ribbon protein
MISCQGAFYKTMAGIGYQKQNILVSHVQDASDSQKKAQEHFRSALDIFNTVENLKGIELQDTYEKLSHALEDGEEETKSLQQTVNSIESAAEALFAEWEAELQQYSSKKLAKTSKKKLEDTRSSCTKLVNAMRATEKKVELIIREFRDQELFLKHNQDEQAISSLSDELTSIKSNITSLIKNMDASISESETFCHDYPSCGKV